MGQPDIDVNYESLLKRLAGPSVQKSGQDGVDQNVVNEIIYKASVGSKYFQNEQKRHAELSRKIDEVLEKMKTISHFDIEAEEHRAGDMLAKMELRRDLSQTIVHVDCDYFYGQVEELDNPKLREVPFGVGGGVLTTCNYVARKFGVRSAMPGYIGKQLCPELIILPLNFDKYIAKADEVRSVIAKYDPNYMGASLDEAYMNITEYIRAHDMVPEEAVARMRADVLMETGLTVSAGIGANSMIAKIGSNKNKPNGQFLVPSQRGAIISFMHGLSVRKINGIGKVFERQLEALGVQTCGDIFKRRGVLSRLFGEKSFEFLLQVYLGLGTTNIIPAEDHERKSIGTESTFRDISKEPDLKDKLRWTAQELEKDMTRTKLRGRTLHLKLKMHTYEVITRQRGLPKAIHTKEELYKYAWPMMEKEYPLQIRLMGLRLTHLENQIDTKAAMNDFFKGIDTSEGAKVKRGYESETFSPRKKYNRENESPDVIADGIEATEGARDASPALSNISCASEEPMNEPLCSCPICGKKIKADDILLNQHIDLCLNLEAVKETVKGTFMEEQKKPGWVWQRKSSNLV